MTSPNPPRLADGIGIARFDQFVIVLDVHRDRYTRIGGSAALMLAAIDDGEMIDPDEPLVAALGVAVKRSAHCAIIGGIHDRASPSLVERPGPEDLVRACWGNYIAFGLASAGSRVDWILRSPMGHLAALRASVGETTLLASHAEDLLYAMDTEPQIDWTFVAEHLACQHLQTAKTGLLEIDELVGGECLRRGPYQDWVRTTLWTPWTFTAAEREIRSSQNAERALAHSH